MRGIRNDAKFGWYVGGAIAASVLIAAAYFFVPFNARQQMAGQARAVPSPEAPGETGGLVAPRVQPGQVASTLWIPLGPLQQGVDPSQANVILEEDVEPDIPGFTKNDFDVTAGDIVSLTLRNDSDPKFHFRHAWVLAKPGTVDRLGIEAQRAGPQRGWIPDSPDVLAHTQLLSPGESDTIYFRAPSEAGDYPFFCPFPGHFRGMQGVLHVKAK